MLYMNIPSPQMPDNSFKTILELCFQRCDSFSLTLNSWPGTTNGLRAELEPYLQGSIVTSRWFSYYTTEYNPLKILLYPVSSNTKAIMGEYCKRLHLFDVNERAWYQDVEDLCFFIGDKLIFGTVSHERICQVFPPDESFRTQLLAVFDHWQSGNDFSEQISLSDYAIDVML
jgi:hypothetical protein